MHVTPRQPSKAVAAPRNIYTARVRTVARAARRKMTAAKPLVAAALWRWQLEAPTVAARRAVVLKAAALTAVEPWALAHPWQHRPCPVRPTLCHLLQV